MKSSHWTGLAGALAATIVAGCAAVAPQPAEPSAERLTSCSGRLEPPGPHGFRIDPAQSLATIRVYRGGTLARLGHDHVVASHDLSGHVDVRAGHAELCVPLERLVVDEPDLRGAAGFDTLPTPEAVSATQRNMLDKVLEVERFPVAMLSIRATRNGGDAAMLSVSLTLHGVTRVFETPLDLDATAERLTASGGFSLKQSDFGIAPLSILGGALQVKDGLDLRYRIVALRAN